jgi:hypothetical protein
MVAETNVRQGFLTDEEYAKHRELAIACRVALSFRQALATVFLEYGGSQVCGFAVSKERSNTGFDDKAPDPFRGSFDVGLRVFEKVIEQFATGDVDRDCIAEFAARLLAEDLVPKPFRILNIRGS